MSLLSVEIKSTDVSEFSGISSKTQKPYSIRKQKAWINLGQDYPEQIEINLERDQQAYPVGRYVLSPESFYIDRNKQLSLRPILKPAAASTKAA